MVGYIWPNPIAQRPMKGRRRRAMGASGLAEVAYHRNELDSALRLVTEGIALYRQPPAGQARGGQPH